MKKIIVIGGATASGKTSLAIDLAKSLNTEILSADSRQCYREMRIGTAVPSVDELDTVKHHFIHSHSIHDHVTAGDYERFALNCLDILFQKHDTVVVVGGTGLYLKALCEGIDEMPEVDKKISETVEKTYHEKGVVWLQEELKKEDPAFYSQGEIQNPMRMLRALSFKLSTGMSILTFRNQTPKLRKFIIEKYYIDLPKDILYERINHRVDSMMKAGLLEEVTALQSLQHLKNLQTVGYTELFKYLDGLITLQQAIEKIKQHTRNYAKRQITWFKNQSNYKPIAHLAEIELNLKK